MQALLSKTTSFVTIYSLSVQFNSVSQLCLTLCDPMNCSMLGLPVHHQLPQFYSIFLVIRAIIKKKNSLTIMEFIHN